ncbi:MAG: tetratricopeptide repeat protein [Vicingaceae bacterium]
MALPNLIVGQNQNEIKYKLALDFFQNKEYAKSIDLLEDLYKSDKSQQIYLPLFASYIETKRYEQAEEIVKKQLRKSYGDPIYTVDYGHVLTLSGDRKKAEDVYEKAIKELLPRSKDILDLANSFQRRNEMVYAIHTLKRGKKLTPSYGYQFELAELYYQNQQIEEMIDEYLDLISLNDAYLQNVQNALNTSIYQDLDPANLQVLNTALLRRIQRQPDQEVFLEMLIWHYLQQKDFEGAILQTKALDRRFDEGGKRLVSLGQSCVSNKEYDLAMECYQYVIDQGTSTRHYVNARVLMTMAIREKITSAPYTQEDLINLESNYIKTLDDVGRDGATVKLQIGLAEVWAFYLNKADKAMALLQRALNEYQLLENDAAKCKLVLADIYLRQGEIWEASLLYSQVEKDFKYEALGDEAKFKNAKVYFYTGDYNWAKAQLDVLKGSTSKLIANDAMRLSLIISDNLLFDTTGQALKDYAATALLFDQGDYPSALKKLDVMERIYVVHEIIDEVYYMQYEVYMKKQDYESAAAKLQLIIKSFPDGILGDEAVFNLAVLYQQFLDEEDLALEMYKKLLADYPASIYVATSRKSYRNARQKIEN